MNISAIMNSTMSMIMENMTMPSNGSMGHHMHGNGSMATVLNTTGTMDHDGHMDHSGNMDHGHATPTMGHDGHMHDGHGSSPVDHGGHMHGTDMPGVTGGMDHGGHDMGSSGHHGGGAFFDFPLPVHILFYGWEVTTQGQLAGACVAVAVLSILYEGLKSLRESLLLRATRNERKQLLAKSNGTGHEDTKVRSPEKTCAQKMFNLWHILFSFMQIIQTTLGMFLMLIYMTFNVWLAVSVSLGSGVGYFLFAWNKRSVSEFDDHCG